MTKHVILVEGHGNTATILQETIRILDDYEIDFIVHWDRKFPEPNLKSSKSKIHFIEQQNVDWGSDKQIKVEKNLLMEANKGQYDYVHLISSSDIPLMDVEVFKNFFKNEVYIGFFKDKKEVERIRYFYPLKSKKNSTIMRKILIRLLVIIQKVFRINRLKNLDINVKKGCNWFSIKKKYINEILSFNDKIFENSFLADELYIQTILGRFDTDKEENNEFVECARYIDWKRGRPYVFGKKDLGELIEKKNTCYAFARKIEDVAIPRSIFQNFK